MPGARWKLPKRFRLLPSSHISPEAFAAAESAVSRIYTKQWLLARGVVPPAPALHPAVLQLIADWFEAVDEDGSRTLEHSELLKALKAARIPCNDMTITEMIKLMDVNGDGVISWDEFRMYMADEFANGKNLMSGEYMLPTGATMNFGVVIGKLRRDKLMKDILEDNRHRSKWSRVAASPRQLAAEFQQLEAAAAAADELQQTLQQIERQKAEKACTDVETSTPRTKAAKSFLGSMAHEARLLKQQSIIKGERTSRRMTHAWGDLTTSAETAHETDTATHRSKRASDDASTGTHTLTTRPTSAFHKQPRGVSYNGGLKSHVSLAPLPARSHTSLGNMSHLQPRPSSFAATGRQKALSRAVSFINGDDPEMHVHFKSTHGYSINNSNNRGLGQRVSIADWDHGKLPTRRSILVHHEDGTEGGKKCDHQQALRRSVSIFAPGDWKEPAVVKTVETVKSYASNVSTATVDTHTSKPGLSSGRLPSLRSSRSMRRQLTTTSSHVSRVSRTLHSGVHGGGAGAGGAVRASPFATPFAARGGDAGGASGEQRELNTSASQSERVARKLMSNVSFVVRPGSVLPLR